MCEKLKNYIPLLQQKIKEHYGSKYDLLIEALTLNWSQAGQEY